MEDIDSRVLKTSATWLAQGRHPLLVTVARTWGSSPRPPGALMGIDAAGRTVGSVSGGCIEDDLIDHLRRGGPAALCPDGTPTVLRYGIDADTAHRFGLPCGGTLELVLEPLGPASRLDALLAALQARQVTERILDLATGAVTLQPAEQDALPHLDARTLRTVLGPRHRLLVIGAGDLSQYLCATALGLGFDITVCDPRPEQRDTWQLEGVRFVTDMPDDAVQALRPDARTAVVALTHDPKLDDLALMDALQTSAFYVGAIGSRLNNQRRRERLQAHFGLSVDETARLRGPAGLYIGSKTPAEIALSILAEIVAAKNGITLPAQLQVGAAKDALTDSAPPTTAVCGEL
ncbi:MAG TPA: XdhC family protein [Aquabacterium sp.]|nr:XdhC family protein [Aquabacterium sp.]